jgi:hypothetical protein
MSSLENKFKGKEKTNQNRLGYLIGNNVGGDLAY